MNVDSKLYHLSRQVDRFSNVVCVGVEGGVASRQGQTTAQAIGRIGSFRVAL